jgi:hypothetical protein
MALNKLKLFKVECLSCGSMSVEFEDFHDGCWPESGRLVCNQCEVEEIVSDG